MGCGRWISSRASSWVRLNMGSGDPRLVGLSQDSRQVGRDVVAWSGGRRDGGVVLLHASYSLIADWRICAAI